MRVQVRWLVIASLLAACATGSSSSDDAQAPFAADPADIAERAPAGSQASSGATAGGAVPSTDASPDASGASKVVAISTGLGHACALTAGGTVKCWGMNFEGQLGIGTTGAAQPIPVVVPNLAGVTEIAAGQHHTCALLGTGAVRCWGSNDFGELGDGTLVGKSSPVAVSGLGPDGVRVTKIGGGSHRNVALTATGAVVEWGASVTVNAATAQPIPVSVAGATSGISSVACGDSHSCAITSAGAVRCWGYNAEGQLGDGTSGNARSNALDVQALTGSASMVAGGGYHTCALLSSGAVSCWGWNLWGQLGTDSAIEQRAVPALVDGLTSVVALAAGASHTCALSSSGGVTCWGGSTAGQLGNGGSQPSSTPVPVVGLGSGVVAISAASDFTCALLANASVRCWGYDEWQQLGTTTPGAYSSVPLTISGL